MYSLLPQDIGQVLISVHRATANVDFLIDVWGKTSPVILTGGFSSDSARRVVDVEHKDKDIIIGFGRYFISNPDIVFRIKEGIELTPFNRQKFYNKGEEDGYITYKNSEAFDAVKEVEVVS